MKQNIDIESKAQSQTLQGIEDAVAGLNQKTNWVQPNFIKFRIAAISPALAACRYSQGLGRDGPPGRARSPGTLANQFPDHPPDNWSLSFPEPASPRACRKVEGELLNNKQMNINSLKQKTNFNFLQTFNFFIMKKQILFLAFLLVAVFASVTNSYGQSSHIAPAPGVLYNYSVSAAGAGSATAPLYTFFVTKNNDLLAGEAAPMAVGTDFNVNVGGAAYNTAANVNNINITWTLASTTTATPFFLVVKYTETLNGCVTENMKVWQIIPVNSFVLAIVPSDVTGATIIPANAHQCVADIDGATMTPDMTAPYAPTVAYTYGKNTLYYKVTASGMLGTWRPDIQLAGLGGLSQAYESAEWNDAADGSGTWHAFTGAAGATPAVATGYVGNDSQLATITDAVLGTSHLIRIVIDNNNFETLADQPIEVGIDGFLPPFPSTTSDAVSLTDFTVEAAYGKKATNTILMRPTITSVTPATFVTKNP